MSIPAYTEPVDTTAEKLLKTSSADALPTVSAPWLTTTGPEPAPSAWAAHTPPTSGVDPTRLPSVEKSSLTRMVDEGGGAEGEGGGAEGGGGEGGGGEGGNGEGEGGGGEGEGGGGEGGGGEGVGGEGGGGEGASNICVVVPTPLTEVMVTPRLVESWAVLPSSADMDV
jgi:hypothetical protein